MALAVFDTTSSAATHPCFDRHEASEADFSNSYSYLSSPFSSPMIGSDILDLGTRRSRWGGSNNTSRCRSHTFGAVFRTNENAEQEDAVTAPNTSFPLPCVDDPAAYCRRNWVTSGVSGSHGDNDAHHQATTPALRFAKGTTTLAFKFNEGIIVSVDSRSTMGAYISSQTVQKVIRINPFLLGTMAGGAADCSFWERNLGLQCRLYELRHGNRRISVAAASKLLANVMSSYRGYGLSMGTMITGWDTTTTTPTPTDGSGSVGSDDNRGGNKGKGGGGGPQLYYVDDQGTRLKGTYFCVGSGSLLAYGVLDAHWRADLTVNEAIDLGRRAIYHATHRDAASGGINNLYHVTQNGWTLIHAMDVNDMHYEFLAEKAAAAAAAAAEAGEGDAMATES